MLRPAAVAGKKEPCPLPSATSDHLLCFSDEEPPGPCPRRVSEWEICEVFRPSFALVRIGAERFESRIHEGGARAWLATLTRC
jgi:hypothetical protein